MLHWDDDHNDIALERQFVDASVLPKSESQWTIRPMERELLIERFRHDKTKKALRDDCIVNDLLIEEFQLGIDDMAMTVIEVRGIPGVGKSVFGLTLARHLQILWKQKLDALWVISPELFALKTRSRDENGKPLYYIPMIRIGSNMQQTTEHVQSGRMGDVVIQDEDPAFMGAEARSVQEQIENLLKIMRQECINMIFISPTEIGYIATPSMIIEVIAKDVEHRVTAAALYDRQQNAHGWLVTEILREDDPLMTFYLKIKTANIVTLKDAGGKESVRFTPENLKKDTKMLFDVLKGMNLDVRKERVSFDLLKTMAMFAGIKGSTRYVEAVCRTLQRAAKAPISFIEGIEPLAKDKEEKYQVSSDKEFLFELENVVEETVTNPDADTWLKTMYDSTETAIARKHERGERTKLYQPKHGEAWYLLYVKNYTFVAAAEELAHHQPDGQLSDAALANSYKQNGWRAIYQEEVAGDAAELVTKKKLFPGDEWQLISGFGKPDIVNSKDDTWIEVKCRNRLFLKERNDELIADFEYDHVREGKPLKLVKVGYNRTDDGPKCRVEIWKVSVNPEWKAEEIPIETEESPETET